MAQNRKVVRTGIIEIDSLKSHDHQWVTAKTQRFEVDAAGQVVSESPREHRLLRRVDKVATEMVVVKDPVTGSDIAISVAGVAVAVKSFMTKWLLEDFDAYFDPELNAVVINEPIETVQESESSTPAEEQSTTTPESEPAVEAVEAPVKEGEVVSGTDIPNQL